MKLAIAAAGTLLLIWGVWLRARGTEARARRLRDTLLALLGAAAALGYFNFGRFHYTSFVHHADFLQLYLGAKYFPELGYDRLYACIAVADAQQGRAPDVARRWHRDLGTNDATLGHPALARPDLCTAHFNAARWSSFTADLSWFRTRLSVEKFEAAMMSHGYNGTPPGTSLIYALASTGAATSQRILALALIDPVLYGVMWAGVAWAFGWRVAAVGMIWWGTNQPAGWTWHGGSFLRALHLLAFVGAICLAKRDRPGWAGASLGLSAALRVFPMLALGGPLLQLLGRWLTGRRELTPGFLRLAVGLSASALVLLAISLVVPGGHVSRGIQSWQAFIDDTQTFARTPLTNSIGLRPVLSFDARARAVHVQGLWEQYPWDTWKSARVRAFAERRWLFAGLVAAWLVLLAWSVRCHELWASLTLGASLIAVAASVPGYYYSYLLVFAFLWPRHPAVGIGLLGLASLSNLTLAVIDARDDLYVVFSIATLAFLAATALVAGRRQVSART